jgi:deoxyribonuclease-4
LKGGVAKAREIGADALQIFIGSPQTWRSPNPSEREVSAFRADVAAAELGPVYVHGMYLINLAAERPDVYEKSIASLTDQASWAGRVGAAGVIFHPGSAGQSSYEAALARAVPALERVLAGADGEARVVLEVCAGQGKTLGARFEEVADLIGGVGGDRRLAVCWDTCHLFAAGYDVASADGLERTVEAMDRVLGLDRLVAVHANDSKKPLGSGIDRHENIGRGCIGEDGFARLLTHPALEHLPFLLEVPGFDGNGPDSENVEILRRLAGRPTEAAVA